MNPQHILLPDGKNLSYTLKVSARRHTIGLRIGRDGLTVYVPHHVALPTVETLLREKSDWIRRKMQERQDQPVPMRWEDGATLRLLGQSLRLTIQQGTVERATQFDGRQLRVTVPDPADTAVIRRKVTQWYAQQARMDFIRRVTLLAARLGVTMPAVYLTNARTRWGSCNSRGEIRLHWRLIQAPPAVIHYVVAHELAHLKEMNHGPRFWTWVEKLCPDYAMARNALKALSSELHLI